MRKKLLVLLTLIATMMLAITGCGGKKIELKMSDYVILTCVGGDGGGVINAEFNSLQFEKDCAGDTDGNISAEELDSLAFINQLESSISYEYDKENELSNGDKVVVNVIYDKELADELNIKFTDTKFEFIVEGLTEGGNEIDPFSEESFVILGELDRNDFDAYRNSHDKNKGNLFWESASTSSDKYRVEALTNAVDGDSVIAKYVAYSITPYYITGEYDKNEEITVIAGLTKAGRDAGYILTREEFTFTIAELEKGNVGSTNNSDDTEADVAGDISKEDIQFLKDQAMKVIGNEYIGGNYIPIFYENEDGLNVIPEATSITGHEIVGIYAKNYGKNKLYYAVGKMHFTQEEIETVGVKDCDKDMYFALYTMDLTSPVEDTFYMYYNHDYGFLTLDELLDYIKADSNDGQITKVD